MQILTGNDAIKMRNASERISTSAFTQSPHIQGMYRLPDGRIAEHHLEFGARHRLLIATIDEAKEMRSQPLNRWLD
jgi:hypothetical protein